MSASESTGPIDMVFPTSIEAILDSDFDGLLDVPEKPAKVTSADRLERAFLDDRFLGHGVSVIRNMEEGAHDRL